MELAGAAGVEDGGVDVGLAGLEPAGADPEEGAGVVEDGGGTVDAGVGDEGAFADGAGATPAGSLFDAALAALLVNRGGSSFVSSPTGTVSALIPVFGASVPAASQLPVAIHGTAAFSTVL